MGIIGDNQPSLLSAGEIAALESIEERVIMSEYGKHPPTEEWYHCITHLMTGIHSRIAMDLTNDLQMIKTTSEKFIDQFSDSSPSKVRKPSIGSDFSCNACTEEQRERSDLHAGSHSCFQALLKIWAYFSDRSSA